MLNDKLNELMSLMGYSKAREYPIEISFPTEWPIEPFLPTQDVFTWFAVLSQYDWEDNEVLPGWYFTSSEESIESFNIYAEMNQPNSEHQKSLQSMYGSENDYIEPYWNNLTLLNDYSDGGCGIGSKGTSFAGKIVNHSIHEPWVLCHDSIELLIDTAIACRNQGVWKDGEPNWELYYKIGLSLNPGHQVWKEGSQSDGENDAPLIFRP